MNALALLTPAARRLVEIIEADVAVVIARAAWSPPRPCVSRFNIFEEDRCESN